MAPTWIQIGYCYCGRLAGQSNQVGALQQRIRDEANKKRAEAAPAQIAEQPHECWTGRPRHYPLCAVATRASRCPPSVPGGSHRP